MVSFNFFFVYFDHQLWLLLASGLRLMFNGFFVHHHFHDCSVNNVHHQNFDDWVSDDFLAGMSAAAFTIFWMKVDNNILLNVVILNILHSDGKY